LTSQDDESIRGDNGEHGRHGLPGGLFTIIADKIEGLSNLYINNYGGSGGSGQRGG